MDSSYLDQVQQNIDASGQHLFYVFDPEGETPPFAYTIGNALHGLPELLIVGNFSMNAMAAILNRLGKVMRTSGQPLPETVHLGGKFPNRVRDASEDAMANWTIQAGQYLQSGSYRVQQILLCDAQGLYPGEAGINPAYNVPLI